MRKNITIEEAAQEVQGRSQAQETLRRLLKNKGAIIGMVFLVLLGGCNHCIHIYFTTMTRILLD